MKRLPISTGVRRLLILPPLLIGIAILAVILQSRRGPKREELAERRTPVRAVHLVKRDVVPRAIGYGMAEPGKIWHAVAQVSGRVIEKNPRAEEGASARRGTVLLRIDPRSYELAVRETEAQIAMLEADLAELETRKENTRSTLRIEQRSLDAHERDLKRKRELLESAVVSQSEVDQEESRYLQQLVRVEQLDSALKLIPSERQAVEASKLASEAKLEVAKLDLTYTTIEAPFACRLVKINFEESQFVSVGEVLAEAHGVDVAEVTAHVPLGKIRHLIPNLPTGAALVEALLQGEIVQKLGLTAQVRMRSGDFEAQWDARVARIHATMDPETRTLGVVVAVDEPYAQVHPGTRPPLVKGLFCEVEIRGEPKPDRVLIPRSAVHAGEVYVVENERLRRRSVQVEFAVQDFVCLAKGLQDGEILVLSDLVPAIEGMLLETQFDPGMEQRIALVAAGEAESR